MTKFKRKRRKVGDLFGGFLLFYKEAFPNIINAGKRKQRMAFFKCKIHGRFFLMTHDRARNNGKTSCPCDHKTVKYKSVMKSDVDNYSYMAQSNLHKSMLKNDNPSWFKVTRMGLFLVRKDGSVFKHYTFESKNKTGQDYHAAKSIEGMLWNRKGSRGMSKAFFLANFSRRIEALVYGDDNFVVDAKRPDNWGWGASTSYFKEYLIKHNIDEY